MFSSIPAEHPLESLLAFASGLLRLLRYHKYQLGTFRFLLTFASPLSNASSIASAKLTLPVDQPSSLASSCWVLCCWELQTSYQYLIKGQSSFLGSPSPSQAGLPSAKFAEVSHCAHARGGCNQGSKLLTAQNRSMNGLPDGR